MTCTQWQCCVPFPSLFCGVQMVTFIIDQYMWLLGDQLVALLSWIGHMSDLCNTHMISCGVLNQSAELVVMKFSANAAVVYVSNYLFCSFDHPDVLLFVNTAKMMYFKPSSLNCLHCEGIGWHKTLIYDSWKSSCIFICLNLMKLLKPKVKASSLRFFLEDYVKCKKKKNLLHCF